MRAGPGIWRTAGGSAEVVVLPVGGGGGWGAFLLAREKPRSRPPVRVLLLSALGCWDADQHTRGLLDRVRGNLWGGQEDRVMDQSLSQNTQEHALRNRQVNRARLIEKPEQEQCQSRQGCRPETGRSCLACILSDECVRHVGAPAWGFAQAHETGCGT
eukprot:1154210-Pelagomonas_calceolata.AAC.7